MAVLLGLLTGGFLFLQTQATPDAAAAQMKAALQKQFPGATVAVQVEGKRGMAVVNGDFKAVHIKLRNFTMPDGGLPLGSAGSARDRARLGHATLELRDFIMDGVQVQEADFEMRDVVYDWSRLKKNSQFLVLQA